MNVLCRWGWHRWRYHGEPPDRRRCIACFLHQKLVKNEWVVG